MTHKWQGMDFSQCGKEPEHTGYDEAWLREFALKSVHLPPDFNVHPRLSKMHIANRVASVEKDKIDWATAEAMSFLSLN